MEEHTQPARVALLQKLNDMREMKDELQEKWRYLVGTRRPLADLGAEWLWLKDFDDAVFSLVTFTKFVLYEQEDILIEYEVVRLLMTQGVLNYLHLQKQELAVLEEKLAEARSQEYERIPEDLVTEASTNGMRHQMEVLEKEFQELSELTWCAARRQELIKGLNKERAVLAQQVGAFHQRHQPSLTAGERQLTDAELREARKTVERLKAATKNLEDLVQTEAARRQLREHEVWQREARQLERRLITKRGPERAEMPQVLKLWNEATIQVSDSHCTDDEWNQTKGVLDRSVMRFEEGFESRPAAKRQDAPQTAVPSESAPATHQMSEEQANAALTRIANDLAKQLVDDPQLLERASPEPQLSAPANGESSAGPPSQPATQPTPQPAVHPAAHPAAQSPVPAGNQAQRPASVAPGTSRPQATQTLPSGQVSPPRCSKLSRASVMTTQGAQQSSRSQASGSYQKAQSVQYQIQRAVTPAVQNGQDMAPQELHASPRQLTSSRSSAGIHGQTTARVSRKRSADDDDGLTGGSRKTDTGQHKATSSQTPVPPPGIATNRPGSIPPPMSPYQQQRPLTQGQQMPSYQQQNGYFTPDVPVSRPESALAHQKSMDTTEWSAQQQSQVMQAMQQNGYGNQPMPSPMLQQASPVQVLREIQHLAQPRTLQAVWPGQPGIPYQQQAGSPPQAQAQAPQQFPRQASQQMPRPQQQQPSAQGACIQHTPQMQHVRPAFSHQQMAQARQRAPSQGARQMLPAASVQHQTPQNQQQITSNTQGRQQVVLTPPQVEVYHAHRRHQIPLGTMHQPQQQMQQQRGRGHSPSASTAPSMTVMPQQMQAARQRLDEQHIQAARTGGGQTAQMGGPGMTLMLQQFRATRQQMDCRVQGQDDSELPTDQMMRPAPGHPGPSNPAMGVPNQAVDEFPGHPQPTYYGQSQGQGQAQSGQRCREQFLGQPGQHKYQWSNQPR